MPIEQKPDSLEIIETRDGRYRLDIPAINRGRWGRGRWGHGDVGSDLVSIHSKNGK